MAMNLRARIVLLAVHVAAVAVLVMTCAQYLNRPLRVDEIEFAAMARVGVPAHGAPVISASESLREVIGGDAQYGALYGLWHPPLYIYLLAVAATLGAADAWLRLVGVLCLCGSFAVIWRMSRDALGPQAPRVVVALPLSLALLSPIVVQGSLFVDIDNTVLATLMLLFLWQFTLPGDRLRPARLAWLTALLVLMLCAKLTTFPMVWMVAAIYAAASPEPRRQLLAAVIVGVAAAAIFAALYLAYCAAFHLPAGWMFDQGFGGRRDLFATGKSLAQLLRSLRWNIAWLSPVLAVSLLVVAVERLRAFLRQPRATPIDAWLVLSLGMFVAYIGLGAMLGKYTMPAALMAAAAIGVRIARGWASWQVPPWFVVGLTLLLMIVPASLQPLLIDRALPLVARQPLAGDPRLQAAAALTAGVLWFGWLWVRAQRYTGPVDRLGIAGLSVALSLAVITPIQTSRLVFAPNDNGPLRAGPEVGMEELVAALRRDLPAGAAVIADKDIGYYTGHRYLDLATLVQRDPTDVLTTAARADVWALVDSAMYPSLPDAVREQLHVLRRQDVGTYRIYVLGH